MNAHDAPIFPILTALNIHPLRRRQGLVLLRSEVEEALEDVKLEAGALPESRLLDAKEIEAMLVQSGITATLVNDRFSKGIGG